MADDNVQRVNVIEANQAGKTWKVLAADDDGNERTYTMMAVDKDTGQPNEPPAVGEVLLFHYGIQTGEYKGQVQTTLWLNEVSMAKPREEGEGAPAKSSKTPPHGDFTGSGRAQGGDTNSSIEWQVALKEAAACLRANLEWCANADDGGVRYPVMAEDVAAFARVLWTGKVEPESEEDHS